MEEPLVDSLAFAEREQVEVVGVVRDEDEPRTHGLAVDREPLPAAAVLHGQRERPQAGQSLAPAAAVLAPVHEQRVEAERDVVQEELLSDPAHVDPSLLPVEGRERADRVVAVEADVPGEVVAGPERDADERNVLLDRHARRPPRASRPRPPSPARQRLRAVRPPAGRLPPRGSARRCRALAQRRGARPRSGEPVPERGLTMRNRCIE